MNKRGSVLERSPLMIFSAVLFILALTYLMWVLPQIVTNPCWKSVMKGFQPLEMATYKATNNPQIVLNAECVRKVVFTTDPSVCEDACNDHHDENEIRSCLKACTVEGDDVMSFIVALPNPKEDLVKRVRRAFEKSSLSWYFEGKPLAFRLDCQLTEVDIDKERCFGASPKWTCIPDEDDRGDKVPSYEISIDKSASGLTCAIKRV
jgi:hypothetical protein